MASDDIPDVGRNSVVAWFNGLIYSEGSVHEPNEHLQPAAASSENSAKNPASEDTKKTQQNQGFWPSFHSLSGFARTVRS